MTRAEWKKTPKNEKRWSKYNKARKYFHLCKLGKLIVLHHINPECTNYEEWNVNDLVPMFTWCHTYLHNTRYQTENQRNKFIGNRKGKHHTAETRLKMSESHKGKPWSEKRKETYLRVGIHVSDEARKKMSVKKKGHIGHVFTEEQLKRMSESHKGQIPPSKKGVIQTDETKRKKSESLKKYYASSIGKEMRIWFSECRARRGEKVRLSNGR